MIKKLSLIFLAIFLFIIVNVASSHATQYGIMKGTILTEAGEAFYGAQVCFYNAHSGPPPFSGEYWRDCEYTTRIGEDGSFSARLPAGQYYILATKKLSGEDPGPPIEAGDPVWPPFNGNESQTYIVTEEGPTDLGTLIGAVPFKKKWLPKGRTAIEGKVLLKDGIPVEGVLVYASGDPKVRELVFISDRRTGPDGKYTVRVDEDGTYFVRVLGASKPIEKAVVYSGETTKGIDIRVKKNPSDRMDKWKKRKKK